MRLGDFAVDLTCPLAVTIGNNLTLATPVATSGNVFAGVYGRWISAVYSTTLATNLSATGTCLICI